jgi:hypothetical protein
MKVIIVTGSRHVQSHENATSIRRWLEKTGAGSWPEEIHLFHGAASGVDTIADEYARDQGWNVHRYPYIKRLGKQGGPTRNRRMVRDAYDFAGTKRLVPVGLAFPGPTSRGTLNCIGVMKDFEIPCEIVEVDA